MASIYRDCFIKTLIFVTFIQTTQAIQLPVFVSIPRDIENYVYVYPVTGNLNDGFTMCMWYSKPAKDSSSPHQISYATDANNNEFLFHLDDNKLDWYVNDAGASSSVLTSEEWSELSGWHWHCFTWKDKIKVQWYIRKNNVFEILREFQHSAEQTISSGGALTIFEEQDSLLGSFDPSQVAEGKIAGFNIWEGAKSQAELDGLLCRDKGDIIHMDNFTKEGSPLSWMEDFPCPDKEYLPKTNTPNFQASTMCSFPGKMLNMQPIFAVQISTAFACAKECNHRSGCNSANYEFSAKTCSLFQSTDLEYPNRFIEQADFAHYTTRTC